MNKKKLIVFIIYFLIISIYTLVNSYLGDDNSTVYLDSMYYDLRDKYNELATINNIKIKDYEVIGCSVIERNIYTFFDEIIINRGINDNVKENNAVIRNNELIGIVSKVYDNYSIVNLITNKDINISVKINDSYGIYSNGLVTNIINYSNINIGDYVYTSGLTNIPSDLSVGVISDNSKISVDLVDISELRSVFVIVGE